MPREGSRRKKKRTHVSEPSVEEKAAPRSMIFRRGKVGSSMVSLIDDMRELMEPYTARRLQESRKNKFKDFVSVAAPLGVTHFVVFTAGDLASNMRLVRLPRGPTLTFRLEEFSLAKDVKAAQRRPHTSRAEFQSSPLVVLNNFVGADHLKVTAAMLQNMFPPINVSSAKLSAHRRVALFQYDKDDECIHFRHYLITASPVGLTKTVKKIIKAKIPNMSKFEDISDYVLRGNDAVSSDSEIEDTPESKVTLPQNYAGRGNVQAHKSAIRLKELGPRLKLKLLKIEEGIDEGLVIYNRFVTKTPEEIATLTKQKREAVQLKARRREQQEENVRRKQALKEEKKAHRRAMREAAIKQGADLEDHESPIDDDDSSVDRKSGDSTDDDDWYRREVGEEPCSKALVGNHRVPRRNLSRKKRRTA